jgi:hypothetical protein
LGGQHLLILLEGGLSEINISLSLGTAQEKIWEYFSFRKGALL